MSALPSGALVFYGDDKVYGDREKVDARGYIYERIM